MTSSQSILTALIPVAYVLGSVPFGLLVGLARGVDVRTVGSGNIGATNVARLLGGKYFALVFTLDLLKSLIPMVIGAVVVRGRSPDWVTNLLWLLAGLAAILGHMFSLFLKFRGGKGVATSAGVMLGLFPYFTLPAVGAIAVFLAVFLRWRYVSLGSILGAMAFPVCYVAAGWAMGWPIFGQQLPLLIFAIVVAVLVVVKHRGNIARLRAGTESRIGKAKAA
jgi:glycerol-3-phosphate acyltransferase PlsY